MSAKPIEYNDFWLKITGSLAASQIIDLLNRNESFSQRISSKYFYSDLIGGFVMALIIWEVVRFVIISLDRKYDWLKKTSQRILLQILTAVILPVFLSFLFTYAFMKLAYNQDIFATTWLYNEVYVVIIIILLINLIYFTWWLYIKWKKQSVLEVAANKQTFNTSLASEYIQPVLNLTIEVNRAGKIILLSQAEVCYAYLNAGYCYIKTFTGDCFVTSYTLDEVACRVNELGFFRVNRQILINRSSCKAYQTIENGKIELELNPSFRTPVIVSQKRARDFRKWIAPFIV